jgi:hypothetical protein
MSLPNIADVIGLPVYYIDTAIPEDAGNGNVRIINCVTRHGVLIPQYECIIHSTRLIVAGRAVSMKAQIIFNQQMMVNGTAH